MVLRSDSGTKEAWTLAAFCLGRQLEPLVGSSVGLKLGFAVGLWLGRKLGRKLGRMVRAFFRARWRINGELTSELEPAMGPSEASAHGGVHEKRKDLQHVLKTQEQIKHTHITETHPESRRR